MSSENTPTLNDPREKITAEAKAAGPCRPIAVDPPGCGCTECLTGEYVPLDQATPAQLVALHIGAIGNNLHEGDDYQTRLAEATVTIPADAFARLVKVAAHVSTGRSFAFQGQGPYPDAVARRALGALSDAGLLPTLDVRASR
ncbi:hypothetical protein [Streptomyces sp. NPDC127072]|uniref:hypothetical protein n=1 Tax=Streptomyces sp. NPDC127072 TaxID=3347129 RepID=UPI0036685431